MNAKDIVTRTFEKAKLGGYKIEEVDEFLRDVSVEYKKLQNENEELEKKLEVLATKIREYRNDEDALRDALLIAKKQGNAIVKDANDQADKIKTEAKEKAEKTINEANDLAARKNELASTTLADAKAKAKQIVDDATAKSEEIHTIMMQRTEREQIVLQKTRQEVQEYTSKILMAYEAHIKNIKDIPAQCENEFVINTAREVENRKPADSAFAKKQEPKADVKPVVKEPQKADEDGGKNEDAQKSAALNDDSVPFKPIKPETSKKNEGKKGDNSKRKGDPQLFNLNEEKAGDKSRTHESLEFGGKKK